MARDGRARIFTFGFTPEESEHIDEALAAIRIPAPTRLRPSQGSATVGEIVERDADGAGALKTGERFVLFARTPNAAVGQLVDHFRTIDVPRPIFATVTETSATWTLADLVDHLVEEKRAHEAAEHSP